MKEFFLKMLDAKDPSVSSGRFLSIITVIMILYVWAVICLFTRTIIDIPAGVYAFAGVVLGAGAVKAFAEPK